MIEMAIAMEQEKTVIYLHLAYHEQLGRQQSLPSLQP
jgi:hypothetical protein